MGTDLVLKLLVPKDVAGEPWLNSQQSKRLLKGRGVTEDKKFTLLVTITPMNACSNVRHHVNHLQSAVQAELVLWIPRQTDLGTPACRNLSGVGVGLLSGDVIRGENF